MLYENNSYYKNIKNILVKQLNISQIAIDGYIYNSLDSLYSESFFLRNHLLSFLLFLLLPLILILLLFKKNNINNIKVDVTLEEITDHCFDTIYKQIVSELKDNIKVNRLLYMKRVYFLKNKIMHDFNVIKLNDYIDKKVVLKIIKILLINPKLILFIYKAQLNSKKNISYALIKLLFAYIKFYSVAINSNTKVYLSANDVNFHLLKDEIFKSNGIITILIQPTLKDSFLMYYKGSDILFCYGQNQKNIYMHSTNNFRKIYEVGSIKNALFVNKNYEKKYDIIFIEQFADRTNIVYGSNEGYIKILENLVEFSYEYPQYKIIYRTRADRRDQRSHIKIYDDILLKIEKSNIIVDFEGNSYERVASSRLTLGYYSTLAFESIGLDVPTLFYYYENYKYEIYDYKRSEKDILILDSSYSAFKESILNRLNSDNIEYFKKYKKIYMNQDKEIVSTITNTIKEFL